MSEMTLAGARVNGLGGRMAPVVTETFHGYEIRSQPEEAELESAQESIFRFLGLVFVITAYAQWLLPAGLFGADASVARAAMTFVLGGGGAALYWYANRGLAAVVAIDLGRREFRFVTKNARNQSRLKRRVAMDEVQSAFLRRSKDPRQQAALFVRLRDGSEVHLADGTEETMTAIHRRICLDVRPLTERVENRLAERPVFVSSRFVED